MTEKASINYISRNEEDLTAKEKQALKYTIISSLLGMVGLGIYVTYNDIKQEDQPITLQEVGNNIITFNARGSEKINSGIKQATQACEIKSIAFNKRPDDTQVYIVCGKDTLASAKIEGSK